MSLLGNDVIMKITFLTTYTFMPSKPAPKPVCEVIKRPKLISFASRWFSTSHGTHQHDLSQRRLLYDLCELNGVKNIFNER